MNGFLQSLPPGGALFVYSSMRERGARSYDVDNIQILELIGNIQKRKTGCRAPYSCRRDTSIECIFPDEQ